MINHELFKKQLKRHNLSEEHVPTDLEGWISFLSHIDKTYLEADQDRYILERSMEISSKEMQELYNAFEEAQKIARIGSWIHNVKKDKTIWSKEIYELFNRDITLGPPSTLEFVSLISPEDQPVMQKILEKTFLGQDINFEFRVILNVQERWMHMGSRALIRDNEGNVQTISGTLSDITEKKLAEYKLLALNNELIMASRRAGMAEVASSVLHNIGNVLNSLNVTCSILLEKFSNSKISNIRKISELINANKMKLGTFIENDPKGKYIPEYISSLAVCCDDELKSYIQYVSTMDDHIQHIKDIVDRQQSLSGSIGILQLILLDEVIDNALSIVISEQQKYILNVKKNSLLLDKILVDKITLLQILVNLIKNAKESLDVSDKENKRLIIETSLKNSTTVVISVEDNGIGIEPENIKKIFNYGFTTKEKGLGIGLHTSSLVAREMGGELNAFSLGKNKGATFVLTIPYKTA